MIRNLVAKKTNIVLAISFFLVSAVATANNTLNDSVVAQPSVSYGKKGFELSDGTGDYLLQLQFRGQFRFAYPYDSNPLTFADFQSEQMHIGVRRARMKVGGHAYKSWLKYYAEYEFQGNALLDFRVMIEKYPWLNIKVGQWKVQYNRERIISSGKQQTMERSILTRPFTIDRQQGVSFFGNVGNDRMANFNYWLSVFEGEGRGNISGPNGSPMLMTRLQWNPNGSPLKFTGSDTEYHEKFKMLLAVAAVTNESKYTRFSTSGGGSLNGFEVGEEDQYRIHQVMQESAGKYRGFSWQQEVHFKQINDQVNNTTTDMAGYLVQGGYVFKPKNEEATHLWEVFARNAIFFPHLDYMDKKQGEVTLGTNLFLSGHRNKLTLEGSYIDSNYESNQISSGMRVRLQWEISF